MKKENSNRTRIIGLRLTPEEYAKIERKWKASTSRKLSDYVRHILFDRPVVTTYRNNSADDFIMELAQLRKELNRIGVNFNQSVKRLHTISEVPEFRRWQVAYDIEKNTFFNKVEEIKKHIQKMSEAWLQ